MRSDSQDVVQVPVEQLSEIQKELEYLRARDAERQAWQDAVIKRLPEDNMYFASESHTFGDEYKSYIPSEDVYQKSNCGGKSCGGCCDGYPCKCGQCPAPCIDCPHVSTLSPYFNVNIFGALKLDMLAGNKRPLSPGTPYFLLPDSNFGFSQNTFDIHARQSFLAAAVTGPQIGCFQAGGMLMGFFYNDNALADAYGILPAQAWGDLKNEDWRFAAGLQFDVFNPSAPTVLPFSALCGSGNAGNAWRGQVRLERYLHPREATQWTLQFALSEPITSVIDPTFRISEDNGWPNIEGRIALGLGCPAGAEAKRRFEMGVSGVVGQIRTTAPVVGRVVTDVWGLGTDVRWNITDVFGVMGEFYTGEALGTYNGGALQTVNITTLQGIRSTGGWLEVFTYWRPCLHSHIGYGIDDPVDGDVDVVAAALGRLRNSTIYGNLIWDVTESFRAAFEVAWRETAYSSPALLDNEGVSFQTQFAWNF